MARARSVRAGIALAVALAVAGESADARGRGAANIQWDEGSRAPVDTWTQDEGCPARTSATESQSFTGPRAVAWRFQVSGEIEGDPLVWRGKTFVVERSGPRRTVHVLATATGAKLYRQSFESVLPPAPCVDDGRLVLRTSPKTIQGLAVGERGFSGKWTVTAKTAIGPPTLVRDEVYVVVDGVLERRTFGSKQTVWPKPKATSRVEVQGATVPGRSAKAVLTDYPRPSVRGESVFLATGTRLLEVDRTTGAVRRQATLGEEAHPTCRVLVGFCDLLVQRRAADPDTDRFGRSDSGLTPRRPLSLPFGAASLGCDWVARVEKGEGGGALVRINGPDDVEDGSFDFATPKAHADFVTATVAPSVASDVVFLAGRSFDADRLELLEPEAVPCVSRVVPLRERVLVVEAKNRLTAWKSAEERASDASFDLLTAAASVPPAVAVVEGGRRVAGGFSVDPKTRMLKTGGKPVASWSLASVQAVVADGPPRRLLWGLNPSETAAAVTAIARGVAASRIVALVPRAIEAGDAGLVQRVHSAAVRFGAPESDLDAAEAAVAEFEAKGGVERDGAKASAVSDELKAALQSPADVLVEVAESLPPEAPSRYATALVRAAADVYPYHRGAAEWVRKALPDGLAPTTFRDLREWLAFLDLVSGTGIEVFPAGRRIPDSVPPAVSQALADARGRWRPDLHGFRLGPLLVIAVGERLDLVARFLILGRVVSDELDRVFAPAGPRREEEDVLLLHFFPDQGEYLLQSHGGSTAHGHGGLEHTAGHYDPRANLTRIFLPGSAADTDEVAGVYAHELTHHWIARRRPARPGEEDVGDRAGGPGYWIVEGIADFVKGFAFDVGAGRATPLNPRAHYADVVAHVAAKDRVPWPKLLAMPQQEAYANLAQGDARVPLRWRMGTEERLDTGNLYYAQSAAVTAYLYLAEDGKHRPALLDFLYDHYAGKGDPDALLKTLGVTAEELGGRVEAWCKATVASPAR